MFSKRFPTFADWFDHAKPGTSTFKRVVNYHYRNPGCTLAEARGHKPKRKPSPDLYVCSWGMHDVPIETNVKADNYYGFLLQAWSLSENQLNDLKQKLKELFISLVEEYIGYSEGDFWFSNPYFWGVPETCTFYAGLAGKWEFIVEKSTGQVISKKEGYLSDL